MLHLACSDSLRSFHMTNLFAVQVLRTYCAHVTIRRNNQHPSISSWNTDGRTQLARVLHRPELSAPMHICLVHSGLQSGANPPHYIFKTNSSQHPFYREDWSWSWNRYTMQPPVDEVFSLGSSVLCNIFKQWTYLKSHQNRISEYMVAERAQLTAPQENTMDVSEGH